MHFSQLECSLASFVSCFKNIHYIRKYAENVKFNPRNNLNDNKTAICDSSTEQIIKG